MDFGLSLPVPSTHPLPVPPFRLLTLPQLVQGSAHCFMVVSGAAQDHRRPVTAGKGNETAQGQRCRAGVGCLFFGLCEPKQIL